MRLHYLALLTASILMASCTDRVGVAQSAMHDIREEDAQPIEPAPEFKPVESFVYSAAKLRSPFMPESLNLEMTMIEENQSGVKPDKTRPPEPLELYELSELVLRGIMIDPKGELYGLVEKPDRTVFPVRVGNHMGKNFGRVVEITPEQVNLIEILPDNKFGYVEKPKTLTTPAGKMD